MPKIPLALRAVPLCKVGNLFATLTSATIFLCGYAENPPGAARRPPLQSGKFVRYAHKCHNFSLWLCRKSSWRCAPSPFTKWEICSLRSQVPQFFFVVMPKILLALRAVPLYKVGNLFATLTSATIFRDRRFVHHIHLCHNFILTPNTIKHASAQN